VELLPVSRMATELWCCSQHLADQGSGRHRLLPITPPRRRLHRLRRRQFVAQVRSKMRGPDRSRACRLKLCRPSSPTHPYRCGGARRHGQIHHVFLPSTLEVPHLMATISSCVTLDRARSNPLLLPLPVSPRAPRCAAGWQAAAAACRPSRVPLAPLNRPPQLFIAPPTPPLDPSVEKGRHYACRPGADESGVSMH
jgi:hypothetical protein